MVSESVSTFLAIGKNSLKAKLIIIAYVKICLIHIVPIHFVDSHFVHCIFIWRCRRTPTRLDPSPAKSLYRASLWLQVKLQRRNENDIYEFKLQIKSDVSELMEWANFSTPEVSLPFQINAIVSVRVKWITHLPSFCHWNQILKLQLLNLVFWGKSLSCNKS